MARYFKGWRYAAFLGGLVGAIGLACYPIIIYPLQNLDKYKEIQKKNRKGLNDDIKQEDKPVWTVPFDRR